MGGGRCDETGGCGVHVQLVPPVIALSVVSFSYSGKKADYLYSVRFSRPPLRPPHRVVIHTFLRIHMVLPVYPSSH
eukprot:3913805-Rhodomonas_salina.1